MCRPIRTESELGACGADSWRRYTGFRNEELDFIINHDFKYRMGREAVGSDV